MSFKKLLKVMLLFTFFSFFVAGCSNTNDTQSISDIKVETDENINAADVASSGAEGQADDSIEVNEIGEDVELGELIS